MSEFLMAVLVGFWVFHGFVNAGYTVALGMKCKDTTPGFTFALTMFAFAIGPLVWPLLVGAKVGYAVAEKAQEKRDA